MLELDNLQIGLLIVALIFTGVVAGILAGLLGVGGGIVIVPVLYTCWDASVSTPRCACTSRSARRSARSC